jgi:voltage-gated potassium channel
VPDDLTSKGFAGLLKLPATTRSPWWELTRRLLMAVGLLVFTVLLVHADRAG